MRTPSTSPEAGAEHTRIVNLICLAQPGPTSPRAIAHICPGQGNSARRRSQFRRFLPSANSDGRFAFSVTPTLPRRRGREHPVLVSLIIARNGAQQISVGLAIAHCRRR